MTKIILKKITSAIFLAIVLIVGTLAAISPSFMIGAHAQQYVMDQRYNNYEQIWNEQLMTRNHMEKTTVMTNPSIVVISNVTISMLISMDLMEQHDQQLLVV